MSYCINYQLEIRPDDTIVVPGCEPSTNFTSPVLNLNSNCGAGFVTLSEVENAIPGVKIKELPLSAHQNGKRVRFLVFPDMCPECTDECEIYPDYYGILKELAQTSCAQTNNDSCEVIDQGFCQVQDGKLPTNPYVQENEFFGITINDLRYPIDWSDPTPRPPVGEYINQNGDCVIQPNSGFVIG